MKGATFHQLTIFQMIVTAGSIRAAARQLEMTPPSVSQSLRQLETALNLPLFTRTTRRIELTEAGQLLYEQTAGLITELDYALENVRDLSEHPSGKVSITLPRFVFDFFFRTIYAEFCETYPDIQLEISVNDQSVDIIKSGMDLGIRFGDRVTPEMVARQITPPMPEALFASDTYIQKYGLPQDIADLKNHRLIQYRFMASNQIAPLILKQDHQDIRVDMPTALIVNDTDAMLDAAIHGLGIGRLVAPMIAHPLAKGLVHPILQESWYPYPGLYVYFVQNSQKARRVRVLIDFLVAKGKQQSA